MSPADKELLKMMFGDMIEYEKNQYKKMFDKHIISYYTDEEIREFTRRESEYRIKTMHTMDDKECKIEY